MKLELLKFFYVCLILCVVVETTAEESRIASTPRYRTSNVNGQIGLPVETSIWRHIRYCRSRHATAASVFYTSLVHCVDTSDVVLGLGPWLSLRTKFQSLVLSLALRVKSLVLALALRLESLVLGLALRVKSLVLALTLKVQSLPRTTQRPRPKTKPLKQLLP